MDLQHSSATESLREAEENFQRIIDHACEGVVIHIDGEIVYVNQKLIHMLKYENRNELMGTAMSDLVHESRRTISKELENTMLASSEKLPSVEEVYETKDGHQLPVEVSAIAIQYKGKPAVQIIAKDTSERKKVEAEIWEYQDMLKRVSSDLILAEEVQRRNLAIVLHDHLGQSLAMAKIKLAGVLADIKDETLKDKVKAVEKDISDAVRQTRSLTYELSPPVLHELGFIIALQWRLEKFTSDTGIETEYDHNVDQVDLRDEQAIILFRSADEILKNIIKHAEADKVAVFVQASKYNFMVKVKDNGNGFDMSILDPQKRKTDSFGLFSIKERLEYLGGVVDIQSKQKEGTQVTLSIPVSLDGF